MEAFDKRIGENCFSLIIIKGFAVFFGQGVDRLFEIVFGEIGLGEEKGRGGGENKQKES